MATATRSYTGGLSTWASASRTTATASPVPLRFDARFLELRQHRGFTTTVLRLKSRPPGGKGIVEEKVDEELKQKEKELKEKQQAAAKEEAAKLEASAKQGEGEENTQSPGDAHKGGAAAGGATGGAGGKNGGAGNGTSGGTPYKKTLAPDHALQKPMVPDIYPQVMALPIAKRPLFPGFYKAVTIKDPNVAAAIQEMMKRGQPYIGAFLFKDEDVDGDTIESLDEVHDVGVFAQITSAFPVNGEDGGLTAVLYPHRRIRITGLHARGAEEASKQDEPLVSAQEISEVTEEYEERSDKGDVVASFEEPMETDRRTAAGEYATSFLKKYNVSVVDVENLVEDPHDKKEPIIRAVTSEIVNVFKEVANLNPLFRDQISTFSMSQSAGNVIDEPAKLADFAAAVSSGEVKELQEVLEALSVEERLQKALVVLKKELMNAQLQSKISKDVEAKIQKRQREYWLMEQMKGIKRELGIESDGKDKLVEKFKEKAEKLSMPEAVKKVFDEVSQAPHHSYRVTF